MRILWPSSPGKGGGDDFAVTSPTKSSNFLLPLPAKLRRKSMDSRRPKAAIDAIFDGQGANETDLTAAMRRRGPRQGRLSHPDTLGSKASTETHASSTAVSECSLGGLDPTGEVRFPSPRPARGGLGSRASLPQLTPDTPCLRVSTSPASPASPTPTRLSPDSHADDKCAGTGESRSGGSTTGRGGGGVSRGKLRAKKIRASDEEKRRKLRPKARRQSEYLSRALAGAVAEGDPVAADEDDEERRATTGAPGAARISSDHFAPSYIGWPPSSVLRPAVNLVAPQEEVASVTSTPPQARVTLVAHLVRRARRASFATAATSSSWAVPYLVAPPPLPPLPALQAQRDEPVPSPGIPTAAQTATAAWANQTAADLGAYDYSPPSSWSSSADALAAEQVLPGGMVLPWDQDLQQRPNRGSHRPNDHPSHHDDDLGAFCGRAAAGAKHSEGGRDEAEVLTPSQARHCHQRDHSLGTSLYLRILSKTQPIILFFVTMGALMQRDLHCFYFVAAGLVTAWTAKLLKRIIRQPRPFDPARPARARSHGMPSTHSSCTAFISAYLLLALHCPTIRYQSPPASCYSTNVALTPWSHQAPSPLDQPPVESAPIGSVVVDDVPDAAAAAAAEKPSPWLTLLLIVLPPLVMHSRVALRRHTPAQCVAGAALGVCTALLAHSAWPYVLAACDALLWLVDVSPSSAAAVAAHAAAQAAAAAAAAASHGGRVAPAGTHVRTPPAWSAAKTTTGTTATTMVTPTEGPSAWLLLLATVLPLRPLARLLHLLRCPAPA